MKFNLVESFDKNYEIWLALNHYLPPELIFILFQSIAKSMDTVFLQNEIFEISENRKKPYSKTIIKPKDSANFSPAQKELASLINSVLDQRDSFSEVKKFSLICKLGAGDFLSFKNINIFSQYNVSKNFLNFIDLLNYHSTNISNEKKILEKLDFEDKILECIVLKYISDLYIDVDIWDKAREGYEFTRGMLIDLSIDDYDYLKDIWIDVLDSSIGSCIRVLEGKEKALLYYEELLKKKSLKQNETFFINSKYDILNVNGWDSIGKTSYFDLMKMTVVNNSLISGNGVGSPGISNWLSGNSDHAYRIFWADIRRSIGRGDFTETNVDKFWYGVSLFEQAIQSNNSESLKNAFKLILESGKYETVKKVSWDKYNKLFKEKLTKEIIEELSSISIKYKGVQKSRTLTFINIIKKIIPYSSKEMANVLFFHLIRIGKEGNISINQGEDISGQVIETLLNLSKTNFDFSENSESLFELFTEQFTPNENRKKWWRQQYDPLKLINQYISYLSEEKKKKAIELVLKHYGFDNTSDGFVKEQILGLLTDPSLENVYKNNPALKEQVKEVVINSAEDEDSDNFMIFIYRFDESLVFDDRIKEKFLKIKPDLLERLKENSTRTESLIKSLIFGLHLLEKNELDIFFNSLKLILTVKENGKRYILFSNAYEHALHLVYLYNHIDSNNWQKEKIKIELVQISEIYKANWTYAINIDELIFNSFSILPNSKINEAIVFNWAYGSLRLAHFLQDIDWLFDILRKLKAKKRDSYKPYLKALVRELSFLKDKANLITQNLIEMIREFDDSDHFYVTVPSLIANLSSFDSEDSKQILEELTKKIFTYGPDKNDTGVLIELLRSNDVKVDLEKFKKYKIRLEGMKEEYELIYPYYAALEFKFKLIED